MSWHHNIHARTFLLLLFSLFQHSPLGLSSHESPHLNTMISFYPNCTLPQAPPAFVSSPNIRGTLDIVWSCLSTIILCTWSILCLPVPPQFVPTTRRQKLCRAVYLLGRKLNLMVITILGPEMILGFYMSAFAIVRKSLKEAENQAKEDGVPWSMTHSFFTHIGGFALRFEEDQIANIGSDEEAQLGSAVFESFTITPAIRNDILPKAEVNVEKCESMEAIEIAISTDAEKDEICHGDRIKSSSKITCQTSNPKVEDENKFACRNKDQEKRHSRSRRLCGETPSTLLERHISLMQEIEEHEPSFFRYMEHKKDALRENIWTLNVDSLIHARKAGIIDKLPSLSEVEIDDRDKSDSFVKFIAMIQISWLVGQLIERAASGKRSTPLEIATVAFSFCAIAMYSLLFSLPQDVKSQTYITASRAIRDWEEMRDISGALPAAQGDEERSRNLVKKFRDDTAVSIGLTVGGTVFGAVHLLGWNLAYPNDVEKEIWRACALFTTIFPLFAFSFGLLIRKVENALNRHPRWERLSNIIWILYHYTSVSLMLVYASCRIFILIEIFRSLYSQPPGIYLVSSANNAPYLG